MFADSLFAWFIYFNGDKNVSHRFMLIIGVLFFFFFFFRFCPPASIPYIILIFPNWINRRNQRRHSEWWLMYTYVCLCSSFFQCQWLLCCYLHMNGGLQRDAVFVCVDRYNSNTPLYTISCLLSWKLCAFKWVFDTFACQRSHREECSYDERKKKSHTTFLFFKF